MKALAIALDPILPALDLRLPLGKMLQIARERRALTELPDAMLRDIGVDDSAAAREAARPFWDLPAAR